HSWESSALSCAFRLGLLAAGSRPGGGLVRLLRFVRLLGRLLSLLGFGRLLLGLGADAQDLQRRQLGPGPAVHADVLLGLVADHVHLRTAAMADDARLDRLAPQLVQPDLGGRAVRDQEDAVDGQLGSLVGLQPVDQDAIAGGDPVLLAAADDHSRQRSTGLGHGWGLYNRRTERRRPSQVKADVTAATSRTASASGPSRRGYSHPKRVRSATTARTIAATTTARVAPTKRSRPPASSAPGGTKSETTSPQRGSQTRSRATITGSSAPSPADARAGGSG